MRAPNRDVLPLAFEIALSPDGKTLAAATGCIFAKDLENPADAGLFLVDLTSPDRKVTRIAPPALGQKGP